MVDAVVQDSGVDARRVSPNRRRLPVVENLHDLPRAAAKAMEAHSLVDADGNPAEHFRELAGGLPSHQVHLEKAILAMHKARCEREICSIAGRYGRYALLVSLYRNVAGDSASDNRAIKMWQAALQQYPGTHNGHDQQGENGAENAFENFQDQDVRFVSAGPLNTENFHAVGTAGNSAQVTLGEYNQVALFNQLVVQQG